MAVSSCLIGGVEKIGNLRRVQNIHVEYTLGGRALTECQILDKRRTTATAYRAAIDQALVLKDGSTTFASGTIKRVEDAALGEPNIGVVTTVEAADLWASAGQRLVTLTIPNGTSLKSVAGTLVTTYLPGITLDAGMAVGPSLPEILLDNVSVEAVFQHLSDITGWVHRLLPTGTLEMFVIGTKVAGISPLTSSNGKIRGGISWTKERTFYTNSVTVQYGTASQIVKLETFNGNGVATSFALTYPPLENNNYVISQGYVSDGGVNYPLESNIGGVTWSYNHASFTIQRTPALANGNTATFNYTVQFPLTVTVQDAGEIAANGRYDLLFKAPEVFSKADATTVANALLRRYKAMPRKVTVRTDATAGTQPPLPGDVITLTVPERTITGDWLITEVSISDQVDGTLEFRLTCLEGSEAQGTWLDFWRQALGGAVSSPAGGTIAGAFLPAFSGQFNDDVIANTGRIDGAGPFEASLRGIFINSTTAGPAIQLGRSDKAYTWDIVADSLFAAGARARMKFIPRKYGFGSGASVNCAMQLQETLAGTLGSAWYLMPGKPSTPLYLGDYDAATGETTPDDRIGGIKSAGLRMVGPTELTSRISPTSLSAATHNWNPTGLATAGRIYLAASAPVDLTGIVGQTDGRLLLLVNASGSDITLKNDSASSSLGNRFVGANFTDVLLRANNGSVWLHYSTSSGTGYWYVHGPMDDSAAALGVGAPHTWTAMQTFTGGVTIGSLELKLQQSFDGAGNTVLSGLIPLDGTDYTVFSITI